MHEEGDLDENGQVILWTYSSAMLNQCAIEPQLSDFKHDVLIKHNLVRIDTCQCGCISYVLYITPKGRKLAKAIFGSSYRKPHWQKEAFCSLREHLARQ